MVFFENLPHFRAYYFVVVTVEVRFGGAYAPFGGVEA